MGVCQIDGFPCSFSCQPSPAAALASSTAVVRNATTGSAYTSLADAVSKAAAGDTLELLADVSLPRR